LRRTSPPRVEARPAVAPASESSPKRAVDQSTTIKFWGVRGSIPTPGQSTVFFGGNTSCIEVRADGEIIILDAGSGIRPLGEALAAEFRGQPMELTLLITHTHWDHIQGFPFFLPAYDARNRVHILGYEGARDGLAATLAGQMESPYFPIALKQMPGNIVIEELKEMTFKVGAVQVEACFSNHPGVCVGYKLHTSSGSIVYLPDNESFNAQTDKAHGGAMPRNLEKNIAEFIQDADVLILDSQYTCDEYQSHVGWGHGCVDDVVQLALSNRVKRLFLFHHDPAHDDRHISNMLMHARAVAQKAGGALRVDAAREGEECVLQPRPVGAF
jgi:phosphoribosyl 1,2-cyclic phosphodiesterase